MVEAFMSSIFQIKKDSFLSKHLGASCQIQKTTFLQKSYKMPL